MDGVSVTVIELHLASVRQITIDFKEGRKKKEREANVRGEQSEVATQKKPIENHFDDCSRDMSGLENSMTTDHCADAFATVLYQGLQ